MIDNQTYIEYLVLQYLYKSYKETGKRQFNMVEIKTHLKENFSVNDPVISGDEDIIFNITDKLINEYETYAAAYRAAIDKHLN